MWCHRKYWMRQKHSIPFQNHLNAYTVHTCSDLVLFVPYKYESKWTKERKNGKKESFVCGRSFVCLVSSSSFNWRCRWLNTEHWTFNACIHIIHYTYRYQIPNVCTYDLYIVLKYNRQQCEWKTGSKYQLNPRLPKQYARRRRTLSTWIHRQSLHIVFLRLHENYFVYIFMVFFFLLQKLNYKFQIHKFSGKTEKYLICSDEKSEISLSNTPFPNQNVSNHVQCAYNSCDLCK